MRFPICVIDRTSVLAPNNLSIVWELTKHCNFGCSYCDVPRADAQDSDVLSTLEFIKRLRPHYDHVEVLLFGGEPTLFHDLQVVVTALRLMSVDIRIHTNFSASLRTYELLSDAGVQIQTTWHGTADPKKFIANVDALGDPSLGSFVMYYPKKQGDNNTNCLWVYDELLQRDYDVELHEIHTSKPEFRLDYADKVEVLSRQQNLEKYVTVWYSDNSESYYHPEQMTSWGFNNFEGWTCSAGKAHVNIDCQGRVYPCSTYMDFNLSMGHVSSLSVDDLKARRCKVKHCLCELYLTKTLEGAICQSPN